MEKTGRASNLLLLKIHKSLEQQKPSEAESSAAAKSAISGLHSHKLFTRSDGKAENKPLTSALVSEMSNSLGSGV